MDPDDLIAAARALVPTSVGSPKQVFLRRAVSSVYYAMFHCIANNAAHFLIGSAHAAKQSTPWVRTYRALAHDRVKKARHDPSVRALPSDIYDYALKLADFQQKRHSADYDPGMRFTKTSVLQDIDVAEDLIRRFNAASATDRRAFVAFVVFPQRQ